MYTLYSKIPLTRWEFHSTATLFTFLCRKQKFSSVFSRDDPLNHLKFGGYRSNRGFPALLSLHVYCGWKINPYVVKYLTPIVAKSYNRKMAASAIPLFA